MDDNKLTRRQALRRLGAIPMSLYVAPMVMTISTAASASVPSAASDVSPPSGGSPPSDPSVPTPPTPPSPPSDPSTPSGPERGADESDESSVDHCRRSDTATDGAPASISADDYARSQASVDAGYAKPLNQIWQGIVDNYPGQIISIRFTGYRYRPRYRLKAVSPSGRLETVIVSARTGDIVRVVGC